MNGKASPGTSRKPIGRKSTPSAKDSCRDSGPQSNRYNRRHDDDHDDRGGPGSKPGWNYGGGGASGSYSRPWRQNSQTGGSGQGGNNRYGNNGNNGKLESILFFFVYFNDQIYDIVYKIGRQQATGGIYKASVLNHFPNNHTDCHVLSPSNSSHQMPYVVNWAYDELEHNSSQFNDVFIEDNYCTTENDYDSHYGGNF